MVESFDTSGSSNTDSSCPSYGCSLLARDVSFDKSIRQALQKVRRLYPSRNEPEELNDTDDEELKTALSELVSCGDTTRVTLTMTGYKGGRLQDQVNQDRSLIVSPYHPLLLENKRIVHSALQGVFDGHGDTGEIVSQHAIEVLPQILANQLQALSLSTESIFTHTVQIEEAIQKAIRETFQQIHDTIPRTTEASGGSTGSIVFQLGTMLYIANVGDSTSVLATYSERDDRVEVITVTRDDKPDLPEERARIEQMGGRVYIPADLEKESARVLVVNPTTGRVTGGLAMSRAIGDEDVVGVIATPTVQVLDLSLIIETASQICVENDEAAEETSCMSTEKDKIHVFSCSATDGLMDYTSPRDVAEAFATAFYRNDGPHPLTVAEDLILQAARGWNEEMDGQYRDDIAVAAMKISMEMI